jgi:3-oxoacyl-[acyl-carrier protein] reductase
MKLKNKTAVVIGGGRDIGRSVSISLAAEGANVVVNYQNDKASAEETVRQITDAGGKAIICQADATKLDDMQRLVALTCETYGDEIHVLANVVGGLVARKALAEMDEAFFDHVMRLNVHSVFFATQAVAPKMPEGSAIVNFASQAGRDGGGPGAAAYATSKGAVMAFTRSMAKELGKQGVRVNAICPGMINTSFHDRFTKDAVRTMVAGATPLGREGNPEECAGLTVYLASSDSSFINGACIDINGGTLFS